MKIAYLLTQNLESPSGLGRYWPMARELARLGHQMQIFALHPDFDSVQPEPFEREGVTIHYVAPMHVIKQGNSKKYYPSHRLLDITAEATWKLTRAAWNCKADIVQICKPHPMNSLAGLSSRLNQKHGLLFLDCDDYEAGSGNFVHAWQKWIVAGFERQVPKRVHRVTTNTHFMIQKLAAWGVPEERILYLPNGWDQERFKQPGSEQISELRNQLGLQGKAIIGYLGSLSLANHAVDLLLQAFAQVYPVVPEARLLVVGAGEDMQLLQAQSHALGIENAVIWAGRVSPEQVPAFYRLSDVTVDPVYDNDAARGRSPLKLFESWACQVPFVTGDAGDRKHLLGTPLAGLMATPGSADSLAENILQILRGPRLANELRLRGLERVQSYTWDRLAAQLAALYQSAWETISPKSIQRGRS